jgi:hypothetical protein
MFVFVLFSYRSVEKSGQESLEMQKGMSASKKRPQQCFNIAIPA